MSAAVSENFLGNLSSDIFHVAQFAREATPVAQASEPMPPPPPPLTPADDMLVDEDHLPQVSDPPPALESPPASPSLTYFPDLVLSMLVRDHLDELGGKFLHVYKAADALIDRYLEIQVRDPQPSNWYSHVNQSELFRVVGPQSKVLVVIDMQNLLQVHPR